MNKRTLGWLLLMATVVPSLPMAQVLGRGESMAADPTPTPRSFFRRVRATPAPQEQAPAVETTPAPTKAPSARQAAPEPQRTIRRAERTETEKPREVSRPKETPKPKVTPKKTEEEKTKVDATTLARDRDISDTLQLVTDFLQAAHLGHYAQAQRALTPAVQKYFEGEHSALGGGLKRVLDTITHDGTIRNASNEVVLRGDGARVESLITYYDGQKVTWTFELVRTKEGWRIELDVPSVLKGAAAKPAVAPATAQTPAPTPQPQAAATPAETPAPAAPTATPQPALSDAPWKKTN
ncbi:MAG: hypothetical protein ACP5QZ_00275 [Candidatus Sumerlaeaceae bacterium]